MRYLQTRKSGGVEQSKNMMTSSFSLSKEKSIDPLVSLWRKRITHSSRLE